MILQCSALTADDLAEVKPAVREYENSEAVRWHILHAVEHYGLHIGHLSLTHQLYVRAKGE